MEKKALLTHTRKKITCDGIKTEWMNVSKITAG